MLTIPDCRRHIELESFLGTRKDLKQSLAKLDVLSQTLINFGQALHGEIDLIEQYERDTCEVYLLFEELFKQVHD